MSYAKLLTDRCDIHHLQAASGGSYGVETADGVTYPVAPDKKAVPSYWVAKGASVTEGEPFQRVQDVYLVHFAAGEDIRLNSKAVWNGQAYILGVPRTVRGHHIEVEARREG